MSGPNRAAAVRPDPAAGEGARVLVVTSTYPQYPGDPRGAFLRAHWESRAAAGARVRILAPRSRWSRPGGRDRCTVRRFAYAPSPLSTLTGRHGVLENLREAPWRAALLPSLWLQGYRAIAREIRDVRPELLVAHMWLPLGVVAAEAARRHRLPFEIYGHGTDVDVVLSAPGPLRRAILGRLQVARRFYLPSEEKAERVRRHLETPVPVVVEPMVHCVPAPDRDTAPAPARRRRILFLGRLIRQKGVDVLLRAVSRMRAPAPVDVAGDGPERSRLVRLARRLGVDATFHGHVEGRRKTLLLGSAAVVCVPSRPTPLGLGEGAPLVVCEALAHGARVVASRVGGIPELCRDTDRARLVAPGDAAALAAALEEALDGRGPVGAALNLRT